MKTFVGFICLAVAGLASTHETTDYKYPNPTRVAAVEDHPWIICNETCLKDTSSSSSCYRGFLVDVIELIKQDTRINYTIEIFSEFGRQDNSTDPPKWTGAIGAIINKKADMVLAVLNVTDELKKVVEFSAPIIDKNNQTLALAFTEGSSLTPMFSHMIKKLVNQRHIEQLKERWFNEQPKGSWQSEKQLTKLE